MWIWKDGLFFHMHEVHHVPVLCISQLCIQMATPHNALIRLGLTILVKMLCVYLWRHLKPELWQCESMKSIAAFASLHVSVCVSRDLLTAALSWELNPLRAIDQNFGYDELCATRHEMLCGNIIRNTWRCGTTQVHNLLPALSHRSGRVLEGRGGLECKEQGWWKWTQETQHILSTSLIFRVCVWVWIHSIASETWKH